jgi:hypothetical protein
MYYPGHFFEENDSRFANPLWGIVSHRVCTFCANVPLFFYSHCDPPEAGPQTRDDVAISKYLIFL